MAGSLDRRQFLGRSVVAGAGIVALGGGASTLLAACGSSSKGTTAGTTGGTGATGELGAAKFQLSWIEDVEFAGEYIADTNGYFNAGWLLEHDACWPAVASVNQDVVVVAAGQALVCISSPDITSAKILQGADLITHRGAVPEEPLLHHLAEASNPLPNPQAMIGKKIGVQSTNRRCGTSFLKANNIQQSQLTTVPCAVRSHPLWSTARSTVGSRSSPTSPSSCTTEGHDVVTFLLNDYNYPLVSQTYRRADVVAHRNKRNQLKALLKAEIMGWRDSLKDPTEGAHAGRRHLRQEPEPQAQHRDRAVEGPEPAHPRRAAPRPRASSPCRTEQDRRHRQDPQRERHRPSPPASCSTCRCSTEVYQENPDLMSDPTGVTGPT